MKTLTLTAWTSGRTVCSGSRFAKAVDCYAAGHQAELAELLRLSATDSETGNYLYGGSHSDLYEIEAEIARGVVIAGGWSDDDGVAEDIHDVCWEVVESHCDAAVAAAPHDDVAAEIRTILARCNYREITPDSEILIIRDEHVVATTWGAFAADNADAKYTVADAFAGLSTAGHYHGGGGAAESFDLVIRRGQR